VSRPTNGDVVSNRNRQRSCQIEMTIGGEPDGSATVDQALELRLVTG
jgi:hypothetical protein